jgi:hypothetical protein
MASGRALLVLLLVLNVLVLLGQVWPAGAPPFARAVNIAFLVLSLAYFLNALRQTGGAPRAGPPGAA